MTAFEVTRPGTAGHPRRRGWRPMTAIAGAPVVAGGEGSARGLHAVEAAAIEAIRHHRPPRIVHACI